MYPFTLKGGPSYNGNLKFAIKSCLPLGNIVIGLFILLWGDELDGPGVTGPLDPMAIRDTNVEPSSAPGKVGLPNPKPEKDSQKIALLPIAPKFGTKEVNRFSQSPA